MKEIQIFPSLLAADFAQLQHEIDKVDPYTHGIHFDVMDGNFVPNLTFGALVLAKLTTKNIFDVHLMVEHPETYIEDFAKAGAKMISFHIEATPHAHRLIEYIRFFDIKAGVVLNPLTSFEVAKDAIAFADFVLIMSVNPGFGGQKFIPEVLEKVRKIRAAFPEKDIQIDGGISDKTVKEAVEAGANMLVSGSYLFGSDNIQKAVESLR